MRVSSLEEAGKKKKKGAEIVFNWKMDYLGIHSFRDPCAVYMPILT